ncbi:MAG: hypothetical protein JW829_06910 [Pirellulales bacterium]|nr:hypothetical protein [Pirellulales bacterium]
MRRMHMIAVIISASLGISVIASAAVEVGSSVKLGNDSQVMDGAHALGFGNTPGSTLESFSAELQRNINFSAIYQVVSISRQSYQTGHDLSEFAAWLYTGSQGALDKTSYTFGYDGSAAHADALQLGIWESMGYSADAIRNIAGNRWYNASSLTLHGDKNTPPAVSWVADFADSGWTGFGDVWIMGVETDAMNPMTGKGGYAMDQLVMGGGSSMHSPEPVSLSIWLFLGLCVGGIYLKRHRQASIVNY